MSLTIQQRSRLLTVPREIRDEIYGFVFDKNLKVKLSLDVHPGENPADCYEGEEYDDPEECYKSVTLSNWDRKGTPGWLNVLLTCRQVHQEAEPSMYKAISIETSLDDLNVFLFSIPISQNALFYVTRMSVDLTRYLHESSFLEEDLKSIFKYLTEHLPKLRESTITVPSWFMDKSHDFWPRCFPKFGNLCKLILIVKNGPTTLTHTPPGLEDAQVAFDTLCGNMVDSKNGCTKTQCTYDAREDYEDGMMSPGNYYLTNGSTAEPDWVPWTPDSMFPEWH